MNTGIEKPFIRIILLIILLIPLQLRAEFYKYTDKSGITHFVDSPDRIPPEYRNNLEPQKIKPDHLSTERRTNLLEQEKQRREKMISDYLVGEVETEVLIVNGRVLVPVVLGYGGREVKTALILDTGATIVFLNRQIANQLAMTGYQKSQALVASGQVIDTNIAKLSYIKVGPIVKNNIDVSFPESQAELGFNGLLGMNFLQNFEYQIDFGRQVITWKKP